MPTAFVQTGSQSEVAFSTVSEGTLVLKNDKVVRKIGPNKAFKIEEVLNSASTPQDLEIYAETVASDAMVRPIVSSIFSYVVA